MRRTRRPPRTGDAQASLIELAYSIGRTDGVGFLVSDITRLMRKGFDRRLRALGLTWPQWRLLVHVIQGPGQSQSALARQLHLGRAPLGDLVLALTRMELVRRERSPEDQREWLVFPNEAARAVLPESALAAEWLKSVSIRGLSDDEVDVLRRTLATMRANLALELDR